jgi:FkbM family methyltransferase
MEQTKLGFSLLLYELSGLMKHLRLHKQANLGKRLLSLLLRNGISVKVDDFYMFGSIEQNSYLHAWRNGLVEPFMVELMKELIRPGMVVLDLGANLGYYTLLAARQVGATGKVYAFEPDPRNYSCLVRGIQRNGFSARVTAIPKAVSDNIGTATFLLNTTRPTNSSMFLSPGKIKRVEVDCTTVDDFIEDMVVVDVIKMHIEGAEYHALKGMERTIERASNNLVMFIAVQPRQLQAACSSAKALIERLEELGFTVMLIDEQNQRLSSIESDIEVVKFVNLYCSRCKKAH